MSARHLLRRTSRTTTRRRTARDEKGSPAGSAFEHSGWPDSAKRACGIDTPAVVLYYTPVHSPDDVTAAKEAAAARVHRPTPRPCHSSPRLQLTPRTPTHPITRSGRVVLF
ncbi:hypothetical protein MTO96_034391 [Rhipicephalus appendiculatus]